MAPTHLVIALFKINKYSRITKRNRILDCLSLSSFVKEFLQHKKHKNHLSKPSTLETAIKTNIKLKDIFDS
jgi:hypothetical protein